MRYAGIGCLIAICALLYGCQTENAGYRLPAVGQVIYCPYCDVDLYQRVSGTSRTAYRRADYAQLLFDVSVPDPGFEHMCPICGDEIVEWASLGVGEGQYITRVYYRDKVLR